MNICSKVLLIMAMFSSLSFNFGAVAHYEVVEDARDLPILTQCFSKRQTLKIKLQNGMEAYLISDPATDKSGLAMVVEAGNWQDPVQHPGLAHFLEHMLFLGTKKYPKESEFGHYIAEHGGIYNAFTSHDTTAYMFTIDNNAFKGGADQFSNFFIEPLFNPSGIDREVQAIDQEYSKNLDDDDRRVYYVLKELAPDSHPHHRFGMGNKLSLQNASQNILKEWYLTHYSAGKMHLIALSNLPIDQLRDLVVASFDEVPNRHLEKFHVELPVIGENLKSKIVYINPVKQTRKLSLVWELPSKFAEMRDVKPELFAAHVLGHEGKGSLLATLKQEKLAEGISAGSLLLGDRNMEFILDISLTDNGVKNVDKVIMHVFETIARLKERGIPQYIYDELHATTTLDYQYMQKSDPFSEIMQHAEALRRESLSTYPQKTYTISHFDQEATNEIISLLTPTNGVYVLLAPQKLTGIAFDKREEWMNVQYSVKPIPMTILQSFEKAQPNPKIDLPEPNLYVPDQLASSSTEQPPAVEKEQNSALPIPTLLIDNNMGKVYFAKDDRYLIPKSFWTFELKTPLITAASPLSFVLGDLYEKQMMEALKDISYPASQAGLTFTIERTDEGISLSVEGYSEKAALLFHDILKEMKSFKPSEKLFKMFKEILDRQYQNTALEKPLAQATEYLKDKLYKAFVTDREKALAIKNVTYSQYEEFCSHLFKKYYVQGLLYGNEEADAAGRISDKIFSELKGKPFPKEEQAVDEVITLPEDKGPFYFEFKGKTPSNVAILAIETVPYTYRDRASQLILMQAMNQPFNASLRTKQQTGYIVTSRAEELELHLFNTFAVQSSTHNGRDLIARFELFIEDFMQELKEVNVPRQRFENIRNALVKTFEQPPTNLIDMGKMLNRLAFGYDGDFLWRQKLIDNFKALSYDEFIDYAVKAMGKQNKRRLAILLKGPLSQNETLDYFKISNASQLIKLSTFQPGKHINDEIVNR